MEYISDINICCFYENDRSVKNVDRKFRHINGQHNRPSEPTIKRIIARCQGSSSVKDHRAEKYHRSARSQENSDLVHGRVVGDLKRPLVDVHNKSILG